MTPRDVLVAVASPTRLAVAMTLLAAVRVEYGILDGGSAARWFPDRLLVVVDRDLPQQWVAPALLHEWAHVVASLADPTSRGHDRLWTDVAGMLGAPLRHGADMVSAAPHRYSSITCCGVAQLCQTGTPAWCRLCGRPRRSDRGLDL